MASISVPNRSMRSGDSAPMGNTSSSEPRTANSPGRGDLADAGIAGIGQALPEGLDAQGLSHRQVEGASLHVGHRRQALQQRVGRQDQAATARLRQLKQGLQPTRGDVRVGREQVVGQDFPVRQRHERLGGALGTLEKGDLRRPAARMSRAPAVTTTYSRESLCMHSARARAVALPCSWCQLHMATAAIGSKGLEQGGHR